LEYAGNNLKGLFAQRRNLLRPRFYRLLFDWRRFSELSLALLKSIDDSLTVGEFLREHRFSKPFIDHYFLPMGSAIWSCPLGTFEQFPIRFIVEFYRNHGLLSLRDRPQWRTIVGGSRRYVEAMTARFQDSIRMSCPVRRVQRFDDRVKIETANAIETFDHVVLACHSDQALRILDQDASNTETDVLSAFPYERNTAVLHTDVSVLPKRRAAWASWNYRIGNDQSRSHRLEANNSKATVSYDMNILQHIQSKHEFIVTLNSDDQIDPKKVLKQIIYHHPIFTTDRAAAQQRHGELIDQNRTSFCGAYWGNGFHEDGVVSAIAVCEKLRAECAV